MLPATSQGGHLNVVTYLLGVKKGRCQECYLVAHLRRNGDYTILFQKYNIHFKRSQIPTLSNFQYDFNRGHAIPFNKRDSIQFSGVRYE